MKNNNTAIVRKITGRTLSSDKRRNFFIIAAIVLTSFMIASVFSIGMGYFESINMREMRMEGSISHMAFNNPTAEQLEILQTLDYVDHVGLACAVGQTEDVPKLGSLLLAHVNRTQWEEMFAPAFTNIVGRFAEAENEIMLSRHILSAMGIQNPEIGMEIPMSFSIYGTDEIAAEVFILSGIFTEYAHARPGGFVAVYTSYALAEKYGMTTLENTVVNIIFKDGRHVGEYIERLKVDLDFGENQEYVQSPAFYDNYGSTSTYITLGIIIALLILTGYLLIYNVMHTSISKDVRFYGMMKTLGTTPRQIRRIVRGQLVRLCMIGLPIGMLAAAAVSLFIVPSIIVNSGIQTGAVVSFSPLIYIGTMLFTIFTVYLGSSAPARKAANISPIESMKFIGEQVPRKNYRSSVNGKPLKMALRNIFREPRRAFLVLLSLFMGIVVFTSIVTIIISWDIDRRLLAEYDYDFSITSSAVSPSPYLEKDFVDMVSELEGVVKTSVRTLESGAFLSAEAIGSEYLESAYAKMISSNEGLEDYFSREEIISALLNFDLRGIDSSELVEFNKTSPIPIDVEAFERGEIALINSNGHREEILTNSFTIGSVFDILIGPDRIPYQISLVGFAQIRMPTTDFYVSNGALEVVVSNAFLRQFFPEPHITSLDLNVESGYEEPVYDALNDIISPNAMISRFEARKTMEESRIIMYALGGGISGILALIGIFNFVNVISVGVIARKRELAALESIGMSKKQMSHTLRYEGLGYWFITTFASLTAGNLITFVLFRMFKNIEPTAQFTYPLIQTMMIYFVMLAICIIVPEIAYRSMNKMTLVERMRETD